MHSIRIRSVRRAGGVLAVAFDETAARGNLKNLSGEYVMRVGTKTTIRRLRQGVVWAMVAVAGISPICPVSATDVTFTGGAGFFDWSQPASWVGDNLPGSGDVAVFSANSGDATVSGLAAGEVAGLRFVNPGATRIQGLSPGSAPADVSGWVGLNNTAVNNNYVVIDDTSVGGNLMARVTSGAYLAEINLEGGPITGSYQAYGSLAFDARISGAPVVDPVVMVGFFNTATFPTPNPGISGRGGFGFADQSETAFRVQLFGGPQFQASEGSYEFRMEYDTPWSTAGNLRLDFFASGADVFTDIPLGSISQEREATTLDAFGIYQTSSGNQPDNIWSLTLSNLTYTGMTPLSTNSALKIGGAGIVVASGAGVASLGGPSGSRLAVELTASQTWLNESLIAGATLVESASLQTLTGGVPASVVLNDHTLSIDGVGVTLLAGGMTGTGGIVKDGAGVLVMANNKEFSGGVELNTGTLAIVNGTVLGTGSLTLTGGQLFASLTGRSLPNASVWNGDFNIAAPTGFDGYDLTLAGATTLTGTRTVTVSDAATVFTVGAVGESGGSYGIVKDGPGILSLPEASTYSGTTVVTAGGLVIGSVGSLPGWDTAGRYSVASGGLLAVGNGVTEAEVATILGTGNLAAGASIGFDTVAYRSVSAAIGGDRGLVKLGPATLSLSGTNTYTGLTDVRAGILNIASTASLPGWDQAGRYAVAAGAGVTIGNGVSDTAAMTMLATGNFAPEAAFGFDTSAGDRVYADPLEILIGSQPFAKSGPNTLTLTGTSFLSGTSLVSEGTLAIGDGSTGSFFGSINNGATVRFNQPDGSSFNGTISGAGVIEKVGPGSFSITGPAAAGGLAVTEGTLTLSGGFTLSSAANVLTAAAGTSLEISSVINGNSDSAGQSLTLAGPGAFYLGQLQRSTFVDGSVTVTGGATLYARSGSVPNSAQGHQFDGPLTIADGTVIAGQLNNAGSNSSIGRNALLKMGSGETSGTLSYQNSTVRSSIARQIQIGDDSIPEGVGGAVIENVQAPESVGSGRMAFQPVAPGASFNLPIVASANRSLTLGGNSTAGNAVNPPIVDNLGTGGTISIVKRGTGLWQLGGENTYTGGTTIEEGTLSINGSVVGDISNDGTLRFNSGTDRTFAGLISGTGSMEKQGGNTLTLTNVATVTGTTITAGTLQIGDGGTAGSLTGDVVVTAGTLAFNRSDDVTFPGTVSGGGALVKNGPGTLSLTAANAALNGRVFVNAGTLEVAGIGSDSSASIFLSRDNDSGTFRYVGAENVVFANRQVQVGDVADGTGSGVILSDGAGTLSFTRPDFSNTFGGAAAARSLVLGGTNAGENLISGVIADNSATGAIGLVKQGAGRWILGGANTYTGPTTVSAGTLEVANADALAATTVTVDTGATLAVASGTTMKAPTVIVDGGTLSAATLAVNGSTGIASLAINAGTVAGAPVVTIDAGGQMSLVQDARVTAAVGGLSVAETSGGGRLDLGAGQVSIAAGGITAEDLRADIIAGRNGGAWNGETGIMSSTAAIAGGTRAVGYVANTDGSAVVSFAAPGDVDLSGAVNVFDLVSINSSGTYGTGGASAWNEGDFNYDGVTNVFDLVSVNTAGAYGQGNYFPAAPSSIAVTAVPEPSSLAGAGAALAVAGWLGRRCSGRGRALAGQPIDGRESRTAMIKVSIRPALRRRERSCHASGGCTR